jgi:hypothetical protein
MGLIMFDQLNNIDYRYIMYRLEMIYIDLIVSFQYVAFPRS